MLGICGTGMGSLAGLLKEKGFEVTGSDEHVYPPMSTQLERLGIKLYNGYSASNIPKSQPDVVVIGNVIRRENPEAKEVEGLKIPFKSMPQILIDEVVGEKKTIVVTGTHGKTTTTSLIGWLLYAMNADPGFLVGGVPLNFEKSYHVGKGEYFVIEGDEYDTAYFEKTPKFLHYRPRFVIITSIEFDHADIYKNKDEIIDSFKKLIAIVPDDGLIVANYDDDVVREIVKAARCKVIGYSTHDKGDYNATMGCADESGTQFTIKSKEKNFDFLSKQYGEHNIQNTVAAVALLLNIGFEATNIEKALKTFKGITRRQQLVGEVRSVKVIDDFAHHPTAIRETILAMRLRYPNSRIWSIFEPRSNTSRRNIFQKEFVDALSLSDRIIIAPVFKKETIPAGERLDTDLIARELNKRGRFAFAISNVDYIIEFVLRSIAHDDVLLIMSNGSFDDIHNKFLSALNMRRVSKNQDDVKPTRVPG